MSLWEKDFLEKLLCKDPDRRISATEALSSPFLIMNSKAIKSPPAMKSSMVKSPSLGKE